MFMETFLKHLKLSSLQSLHYENLPWSLHIYGYKMGKEMKFTLWKMPSWQHMEKIYMVKKCLSKHNCLQRIKKRSKNITKIVGPKTSSVQIEIHKNKALKISKQSCHGLITKLPYSHGKKVYYRNDLPWCSYTLH